MPFWPWTIVPYWSSDLLYGMSLLACSTRRELDVHAARLFAAQMISILCFLVFPLRCVFSRPEVSGLFARFFDVLNGFDRPFNQAPSLHVSLAVVLWICYRNHLHGPWRTLMGAWLVLVGASTMTTWQHQFIDLPTGVLAGMLAAALVPSANGRGRRGRRLQLATFYLSGSVLCIAAAFKIAGLAWILIWPAIDLFVVAFAYAADRPEVFAKHKERLRPLMFAIMAPYQAAAWANSRCWTQRDAPALEIADGVWLGRAPAWFDRDAKEFRSVVDLSAELRIDARGADCGQVPMLDLLAPSPEQLRQAVAAIENFERQRPTLVCCALGFSRSASSIAAWLVATGRASCAGEATGMIRRRQPRIVISGESEALIDRIGRLEASSGRV